jgi:hypothetical protein
VVSSLLFFLSESIVMGCGASSLETSVTRRAVHEQRLDDSLQVNSVIPIITTYVPAATFSRSASPLPTDPRWAAAEGDEAAGSDAPLVPCHHRRSSSIAAASASLQQVIFFSSSSRLSSPDECHLEQQQQQQQHEPPFGPTIGGFSSALFTPSALNSRKSRCSAFPLLPGDEDVVGQQQRRGSSPPPPPMPNCRRGTLVPPLQMHPSLISHSSPLHDSPMTKVLVPTMTMLQMSGGAGEYVEEEDAVLPDVRRSQQQQQQQRASPALHADGEGRRSVSLQQELGGVAVLRATPSLPTKAEESPMSGNDGSATSGATAQSILSGPLVCDGNFHDLFRPQASCPQGPPPMFSPRTPGTFGNFSNSSDNCGVAAARRIPLQSVVNQHQQQQQQQRSATFGEGGESSEWGVGGGNNSSGVRGSHRNILLAPSSAHRMSPSHDEMLSNAMILESWEEEDDGVGTAEERLPRVSDLAAAGKGGDGMGASLPRCTCPPQNPNDPSISGGSSSQRRRAPLRIQVHDMSSAVACAVFTTKPSAAAVASLSSALLFPPSPFRPLELPGPSGSRSGTYLGGVVPSTQSQSLISDVLIGGGASTERLPLGRSQSPQQY